MYVTVAILAQVLVGLSQVSGETSCSHRLSRAVAAGATQASARQWPICPVLCTGVLGGSRMAPKATDAERAAVAEAKVDGLKLLLEQEKLAHAAELRQLQASFAFEINALRTRLSRNYRKGQEAQHRGGARQRLRSATLKAITEARAAVRQNFKGPRKGKAKGRGRTGTDAGEGKGAPGAGEHVF